MASAGHDVVRWFTAAAAPFFTARMEKWTGSVRVPFVVAAVTAAAGALVVVVRRKALIH